MRQRKALRAEELTLRSFDAFFLSPQAKTKVAEFTVSRTILLAALKDYYSEVYPSYIGAQPLNLAVRRWQKLRQEKGDERETPTQARTALLGVLALTARNELEDAFDVLFNPLFTAVLTTAQIRAEMKLQEYLGLPESKFKAKQLRKEVDIWKHVGPYLGLEHGGDRRPTDTFRWDDEKRKQLAQSVQQLPICNGLPLWEYITEFFQREKYDPQCISMLSGRSELANVPSKLLKVAFDQRRTYWGNSKKIPRKLSPLAFALQHARILLGIPTDGFETLKKQYYAGLKLP
jgi:hypothetical protein